MNIMSYLSIKAIDLSGVKNTHMVLTMKDLIWWVLYSFSDACKDSGGSSLTPFYDECDRIEKIMVFHNEDLTPWYD
jgi:hypothetical protein